MDTLLMLRAETRHCDDCGTATMFLPVEELGAEAVWICTTCDSAVVLAATLLGAA